MSLSNIMLEILAGSPYSVEIRRIIFTWRFKYFRKQKEWYRYLQCSLKSYFLEMLTLLVKTWLVEYLCSTINFIFISMSPCLVAGSQNLGYRLMVLFLPAEIFSKRRKSYSWNEKKPEYFARWMASNIFDVVLCKNGVSK